MSNDIEIVYEHVEEFLKASDPSYIEKHSLGLHIFRGGLNGDMEDGVNSLRMYGYWGMSGERWRHEIIEDALHEELSKQIKAAGLDPDLYLDMTVFRGNGNVYNLYVQIKDTDGNYLPWAGWVDDLLYIYEQEGLWGIRDELQLEDKFNDKWEDMIRDSLEDILERNFVLNTEITTVEDTINRILYADRWDSMEEDGYVWWARSGDYKSLDEQVFIAELDQFLYEEGLLDLDYEDDDWEDPYANCFVTGQRVLKRDMIQVSGQWCLPDEYAKLYERKLI